MDHRSLADDLLATPGPLPGSVAPRYDGRGIAAIGPTLLRAFGVEHHHPALAAEVLPPALLDGVDRVVCLIVDAFGYLQLLDELARQPDLYLGRLLARDGVSFAPLTSTFPSTTVNALTTINTAALPAEHGILGYTLYLWELGAVSEMIRFGPFTGDWRYADAGVDPRDFLARTGVGPLYGRLRAEAGVAPFMVNYQGYRNTALTQMHSTGTEYVSYLDLADMAVHIRQLLEQPSPERMLISAYYGVLDGITHVYGTGSPEHAAEVAKIDFVLRRELFERVRQPDTLFLMLADHGHINCTPERTIDLLDHPELLRGLVAAPTGEGRARYLHVRHGHKDAVRQYLTERFGDVSTLIDSEEAISLGLFGHVPPSQATRERVGDLLLLPHENWYFHHYPTERLKPMTIIGRHGGLSPQEMLVPLIAMRLG
jgi:hypothetical protein